MAGPKAARSTCGENCPGGRPSRQSSKRRPKAGAVIKRTEGWRSDQADQRLQDRLVVKSAQEVGHLASADQRLEGVIARTESWSSDCKDQRLQDRLVVKSAQEVGNLASADQRLEQ